MQRIMIVSDSHRRHGNLAEAIYNEQPFDLLIHLGDIEGEEDIIQELAGGETIMVPGNNDFFSPLPREREIELAGKKVLLTHGHYYYVSLDLQTLREECIARGIDIVMFGHTHRPLIQIEDELTFINPGSISYPRQADKRCTYIMLEIDDNGVPYWVAPVKKYNIGLFGGETVGHVVLCNAITGEMQDYRIDEVPEWIDRAYSADLLVQLYDYYGTLKHGYFNSVLSQKDCLKTTNGYNYLAIDDDVWVYTGVTSVNSDQSNVGFVLMNQRTMETKYYPVAGAIEDSAMASAEGQVQNLKYRATFPLLLNISGEPTYFMALKDDAGLVKKYAMVNVQKYQVVAIGDTVSACEESYNNLLLTNGIKEKEEVKMDTGTIEGKITKIAQGVIDGDSHYYIMLEGSDEIFDVSVVDFIEIIKYNVGDDVKLEYAKGDKANTVLSLK